MHSYCLYELLEDIPDIFSRKKELEIFFFYFLKGFRKNNSFCSFLTYLKAFCTHDTFLVFFIILILIFLIFDLLRQGLTRLNWLAWHSPMNCIDLELVSVPMPLLPQCWVSSLCHNKNEIYLSQACIYLQHMCSSVTHLCASSQSFLFLFYDSNLG